MDRQDFSAGLELLMARIPDHPLLPPIKRGYSFINTIYLQKALDDIDDIAEDDWYEDAEEATESELDQLFKEMKNLFTKRSMLSNQFHDVADDASRLSLSKQIDVIQDDLAVKMRQIDYFKKNGRLPLSTVNEKYPVPESPLLCTKKRNSLSSSISRAKKELRELQKRNASEVKIKEKEHFLREKQIHLSYVDKALESAGIHGKRMEG